MRDNKQFSEDGDEDKSSSLYCWWRSCATSEELRNMKVTSLCDVAELTPRLKVMREMERLALMASEGLDDLRCRLLAYRAGDLWVPIGGINKEEMEIPSINTILLVGFTGGGKSSLVNYMYSVLARAGVIPFAQTSGSSTNSELTTMTLEEHNVLRSTKAGFCVYDSRGFRFGDPMDETLMELSQWTNEGVQHNQLCYISGDDFGLGSTSTPTRFVKRHVNCVMVVANMSFMYDCFKASHSSSLESTKLLFSYSALKTANQNPILILTHGDKLTAEERIECRVKICQFLEISETNGVYDIVCLTECGVLPEQSDPITAYAVTEAVYRAILISDITHLPKQNFKDKLNYTVSWVLLLIASFCSFLARLFSGLSRKHRKLKSY
ncbi:unnamed protein product [Amaranthus hypochondriacus]